MTASEKRLQPSWKAWTGATLQVLGFFSAIILPPLTISWLLNTEFVMDTPSFYGSLLFAMAIGLPGLLISTTKKRKRYVFLAVYLIIGGPCLFAFAMLLIALRMKGG